MKSNLRAIRDKKLKSTKIPSYVFVLKRERRNTVSLRRALRPEGRTDALPVHRGAGLHPTRSWSSAQSFDEVSGGLLFN